MSHNTLVHLLECELQNFPDGGLSASRWANKNDSHSLPGGLVELQNLLDLFLNILKLELLKCLFDSRLQRLIRDILRSDSWKHVSLKIFVLFGVRVSQLRDGVYSDRLDQQQSFRLVVKLGAIFELVLDEPTTSIQDGLQSSETPIVVLLS